MKITLGLPRFKANATDIVTAISRVSSVVSYVKADEQQFFITTGKDCVKVVGKSSDALAIAHVDAVVHGKGSIFFCQKTLAGTLKGRKEGEFVAEGSTISYAEANSRFKASLNVKQLDENDSVVTHTGDMLEFDEGAVSIIREGAKLVTLQDVYTKQELPIVVDIVDKGIKIYCFDDYHLSMFARRYKAPTVRFALPAKAFPVVDKFLCGKIRIGAAHGRIFFSSETELVSVPQIQMADDHLNIPNLYLGELKKMKPMSALIIDKKVKASVRNMGPLMDTETKLVLNTSEHDLELSLAGKSGTVSDTFLQPFVVPKMSLRLDAKIFLDLFSKTDNDAEVFLFHVPHAMNSYMCREATADGTLTLVGIFEVAK